MAMPFFNSTGTIGVIYTAFTQNVSGSELLTLVGIIILIVLFFLMFRIPVEATVVLVLPIVLIFMAFSGNILPLGLAFLLYVGGLLAKNWLIG
jgi:hypothetical protein